MNVETQQPAPAVLPVIERPVQAEKTRVLYIGGQGRSGSTLLGRLLGEIDGFVHVGEVGYIWYQNERKRICGCGAPFSECPFWSEVVRLAFGSFNEIDLEGIRRTKKELESLRTVHKLLLALPRLERRGTVKAYLDALEALYRAIPVVAGARVVVDGSKAPQLKHVLDRIPSLDVRAVHLVRDSRAVAYSNQRAKSELLSDGRTISLGKLSPVRVSTEWNIHNMLMRMRARRKDAYLLVRYEDAVKDPCQWLANICELAGEPAPDLKFLSGGEAMVGEQHNINGNPDRFQRSVKIRVDSDWRHSLAASHRRVVTSMTLPLLWRYGYLKEEQSGNTL